MSKRLITKLDSNTSYQYFYNEFMAKNIVCIFDKELTQNWRSRKEWLSSNGRPNLDLLNQLFGKALVPVSDCNTKYFNSNPKQDMIFSDFINYWLNVQQSDHKYSENNLKILYLKDWHFMNQFPDYKAYETPIYFESDWINEYFINRQLNDDYRFVYMGPKHSSTPLHTDVFGSYSWSANICGTKKWLIIPPGNEDRLKKLNNNIMPHDFYSIPNCMDQLESMEGFEVIQNSGEIIFIPSGYIHQVINIEDTISINHNWFNACNIDRILRNCLNSLSEVENELSDLKELTDVSDWNDECQMILKIHFGLNLKDLIDCLCLISERIQSELLDTSLMSSQHSFRLICDRKALLKLLSHMNSSCNLLVYRSELKQIEDNLGNKCNDS